MSKKILFLTVVLIAIPALALGQCADPPSVIIQIVCGAETTALGAIGAIVVILWIVTGIMFLLAQGSPEKLNGARKAMMTSIIGTIIAILAYFAIEIVGKAFNIY